jgi:hypothetical protein
MWDSATLCAWTKKNVIVGKSRLCRTFWARFWPGTLRWKDAPIWDAFVDPYYRVEQDVPVEDYTGFYERSIYGGRETVVKTKKAAALTPRYREDDYNVIGTDCDET